MKLSPRPRLRAHLRRLALDRSPLPESAIQRAVFQHLAACGCGFAFHVPNGGWRSPVEAKIPRELGVQPGVPDLIVIKDGLPFALELGRGPATVAGAERGARRDARRRRRCRGGLWPRRGTSLVDRARDSARAGGLMPLTALRPWHAVRARPDAEGRALIGIEAAPLTGYLPVELVRCS